MVLQLPILAIPLDSPAYQPLVQVWLEGSTTVGFNPFGPSTYTSTHAFIRPYIATSSSSISWGVPPAWCAYMEDVDRSKVGPYGARWHPQ